MLIVLVLYCAFLLGMLLWAVLTALKEPLAFNRNKVGLPNPWYFENIPYVLKNAEIRKEQGVVPFGEIVWNSLPPWWLTRVQSINALSLNSYTGLFSW